MKRIINSMLAIGTILVLSSGATRTAAQTAGGTVMDPWPLIFSDSTGSYTVFEPQCDSWDGHQFTGRSAVAVQPYGQSQPTYGVIGFSAITLVNKNTRTVTLAEVKVTGTDFPSAKGDSQKYQATLRDVFPERAPALLLDRLEGSLTYTQPQPAGQLLNAPPKIIIAQRPAVLVSIDGPAVWRAVPGTGLERAINTRVFLLKDAAGHCYLHLFDGYLQANSLSGPWTVAARPPEGAASAEKDALDSGEVDLMEGTPDAVTHAAPSLSNSVVPDIDVATTPSELITFSGPPEYVAIPGTDLLYADNTSGNVFKLLTDQQNYILISGRWYRAPSLSGPWRFVPGGRLPPDFANIPDSSPKENVKASVPGTPQAEEALMANSIPESTAVARTEQMQNPQVDGAMQLLPIDGTPLHYVANSGTPIIEVDPQSWYACQDGVWYAGNSANGPWTVAASVPAVIYTIPDSSPLHYLTYVQVYDSTPSEVYEGYTPGYLGTEVADDGTVVYGTGYDYAPWIGSVWYGPPVTWGCGFDDCWTPWWGWGFNCGFGWGCGLAGIGFWGCSPPFPWWGGFGCWNGFDRGGWRDGYRGDFANTGADFYHRRDDFGRFGRNDWRGRFAADTFGGTDRRGGGGWTGDYGHAYNSRTGQLESGQWARVQGVYGSAWNPGQGTGRSQASFLAMRNNATAMNTRGWGNNTLIGGNNTRFTGNNTQFTGNNTRFTGNNTMFSSGLAPMSPFRNGYNYGNGYGSYAGREGPFYSPRFSGESRGGLQNFSPGGFHSIGGFGSSSRGGGWFRGMGSVVHSGGGGSVFHGGGGGGDGGGGYHGGGGGGGGFGGGHGSGGGGGGGGGGHGGR